MSPSRRTSWNRSPAARDPQQHGHRAGARRRPAGHRPGAGAARPGGRATHSLQRVGGRSAPLLALEDAEAGARRGRASRSRQRAGHADGALRRGGHPAHGVRAPPVAARARPHGRARQAPAPYEIDEGVRDRGWLAARVEGKSSLARFGLLAHFTAPTIHAGFEGHITLEMMNLGPSPIILTPGMAICQLILEQVHGVPDAPANPRTGRRRRSPPPAPRPILAAERCPSGLRCRSRKAVGASLVGSNPTLSASAPVRRSARAGARTRAVASRRGAGVADQARLESG